MKDGQGDGLTLDRPRDRLSWSVALRMFGPAYLVAVGYMDPGNWATDLAAGSRYGYGLLWVVAASSLMAMVLQSLCCRLGIATGLDLAQASRRLLPDAWRIPLWLLAEVAIVACDLAELVGSAIALQLLFGLPLPWGVALWTSPAGGPDHRLGGVGGRLLCLGTGAPETQLDAGGCRVCAAAIGAA
jgi:Mn2+/Fe2+ NRAMP family transporter